MNRFLLLALTALPFVAYSAPTQAATVAPGGYITSATGQWNGGSGWPGDNFENGMIAGNYGVQWETFSTNVLSQATASYASGSIAGSCAGTARFGKVTMNSATQWPNTTFTRGGSAGGWTDKLTITSPGLTGQTGTLIFHVNASALLTAAGFSGASNITVAPYRNKALIPQSSQFNSAIALLGGIGFGTDRQAKRWSITSANNFVSSAVGGTILFTTSFVFGTQFELGVFGWAYGSSRSSSSVGGTSTGNIPNAQFQWAGISQVLHGSNPVSEWAISSLSGRNWTGPYAATVSGTLQFGDYVGNVDNEVVSVELRNSGGTVVETFPAVAVGADGSYSLQTASFGDYSVAIRGRTWVKKLGGPVTLASGQTATVNLNLQNGDADQSGEVDAADIDLVISKFGLTTGQPGFNPNADLDGSAEVDAADIDISIANFGAADE